MSRYRTFNDHDTPPLAGGDVAFTGVNAKLGADLLEAGQVHDALNVRFRRGRAETREGSLQVQARALDSTHDYAFSGSGLYSDPLGVEWLAVSSAEGKVILFRHGCTPRPLAIPSAFEADAPQHYVQAFRSLLLFRGEDAVPWQWPGDTREPFAEISQDIGEDNTRAIPSGSSRPGLAPVVMNNRVFVPYGRDRIAVSDLLDFTRYDAALADFNVNSGTDDILTALYPFANNTLLVFKDQSTFAIANVYGDLSQVRLDQVNREVGCSAGRSVAAVGGDVFWLGRAGVWRLQQIVQERLQTAPVPVSDPIQPLIDRITGSAIATASAAVVEEYYYLAVPLDGATRPQTILAFNTVTGAWEGAHTFPFAIDALHVTDYLGRKRLFAVDYAAGRVLVLYIGKSDIYRSAGQKVEAEIATRLETRAYGLGVNGVKLFRAAEVTMETWRPRFSVSVATDGVAESSALASARTRSRTAATIHAGAPYSLDNAGDDHARPYREDYAWLLTDSAALHTAGIVPERMQASRERYRLRALGRSATLTIASDQGALAITSTSLDGEETLRRQSARV